MQAVAQFRSEAAAADRRSVLLGLGSLLTAVQASPSFAAKETAQVGDYLPAVPGLDGFVEFIPDRKKVVQRTALNGSQNVPMTSLLAYLAHALNAVACCADTSNPSGNGK